MTISGVSASLAIPVAHAEKREGKGVPNETSARAQELTAEQQRQLNELKSTDRKVRAHEQAHIAVGGDLVRSGASFSYVTGPDDRRYVVAGEVSIDVSPGRTPEETIPKAQHIKATALAPADPSAQDRSVAARAAQMETDARRDLSVAERAETGGENGNVRTEMYRGVENGDANTLGENLDVVA